MHVRLCSAHAPSYRHRMEAQRAAMGQMLCMRDRAWHSALGQKIVVRLIKSRFASVYGLRKVGTRLAKRSAYRNKERYFGTILVPLRGSQTSLTMLGAPGMAMRSCSSHCAPRAAASAALHLAGRRASAFRNVTLQRQPARLSVCRQIACSAQAAEVNAGRPEAF
jgi:hypothetical protein